MFQGKAIRRMSLRTAAVMTAVGLTAASASAAPLERKVPPRLRTSAGTTLADVVKQAIAEQGLVPSKPRGKERSTSAMSGSTMVGSSMADMAMSSTPLTVTGPTGLAPNVGGTWNDYAATIPGTVGSVHAVLLDNGKVLIMAGSGNQYNNFAAGKFYSYVWDPSDNTFTYVATPYDMFCSGHVLLSNGDVLVLGGTTAYPQFDANGNLVHDWDGSKQSYVFNPSTNAYTEVGSMATARWYPSAVTLANGKVLVAGGLDDQARALGVVSHNTDTLEEYDPATQTYSSVPSLDFSLTDPSYPAPKGGTNQTRTLPFYPGLVLLEDGRVFYSGESNGDNGIRPGILDPVTGGFQSLATQLPLPYQRNAGATVLLPPAQSQNVMVMGGGDYSLPTTNTTEVINLKNIDSTNPNPTYVAGPHMSAAKMYVGAVDLPDYTVLETNGASEFRQGGVHTAEIYNPTTNSLTVMNSPALDRLYHSEALLLPDGRVAILGSQPLDGSFQMHISIYSPPYLFKGQRPTINFGVNQLNYTVGHQGYYDITTAPGTTLAHMALVRPSATTHSTDPDQRLVDLPFERSADGHAWTVDVPTNPSLAPPGWYMLFATDSNGVPSVAEWVHLA